MATNSGLWKAGFGEIGASLKALEDAGVTLEHLARLRSDKYFAKSVGAFIANGGSETSPPLTSQVATEYALQVNQDIYISEALKAGKYDLKNPAITTEHFPTTRKGVENIVLRLIHFDRDISSRDAVIELGKRGLRSAEIREMLVLGAEQPDLQRQFPIIALGSFWKDPHGNYRVPYLRRCGSERYLDLGWYDNDKWDESFRFAAVLN